MIETVSTQLKAIAFDRDRERLTENFTGREWVFKEIDQWLQQENERFFILTGEPGVGKSAIAARLTQIRDDVAAYHFCRAGDVETVRPGRILRSLAAQLGEHLPDYGHALANTIKPVHVRIEVNINIGSMTGSEVTGVYIENLKESDPENELDILIRAPLEELHRMYAERQQEQPALAIILIDSLDEAVTTTGTNLIKLLTQLSKSTSLPSWIRFVMTSRPERRVLRGFEPLKPYQLQEKSDESLSDIRQYVNDRVAQPALQNCLQVNQVQPQTLINEITNLSHGNFLYTTLLLNDIEAGRQALDNLAALPKSIDDIYHGFLSRFSEEDWSDRYKLIFGVLTVALEPISEKQISNFTKVDPEDVRDSIRIARQFFDVEIAENNKEVYSIFHQSLRDYLLDEDRNPDFWCNGRKQHQRIIDYCKNKNKSWLEIDWNSVKDKYIFRHLAYHLKQTDRHEELCTLLTGSPDWMESKFIVCTGDAAYMADLELAISGYFEPLEAAGLLRLLQLHTARQVVYKRVNTYSENNLKALVWLGSEAEALSYVRLRDHPEEKFNGLLTIYYAQQAKGQVVDTLLDEAWQVSQEIKQSLAQVKAISNLVAALSNSGRFSEAMKLAMEVDDSAVQVKNFSRIALDLVTAEQIEKAETLFKKAQQVAQKIDDNWQQSEVLRDLANSLIYAGHFTDAEQIAQVIQIASIRSEILRQVAKALIKAGQEEQAKILLAKAEQSARTIKDTLTQINRLRELTFPLKQIGQETQAKALFAEVEQQVQTLEDDAERVVAMIGLALTLNRLGQELRAQEILNRVKKITLTIEDEAKKTRLLRKLGIAIIQFGDGEQAIAIFKDAFEVARVIDNDLIQEKVLSQLATALIQAGNYDEAEQVISEIQDEKIRAEALSLLIGDMAQSGYFDRCEQLAQTADNYHYRAELLRELTVNLVKAGQDDRAKAVFAKAEQLTQANGNHRDSALAELTAALAQSGYLIEAEQVSRMVKQEQQQAYALKNLANILIENERFAEVERIALQINDSTDLYEIADSLIKIERFSEAEKLAQRIDDESKLKELAIVLIEKGCFSEAEKLAQRIDDGWKLNELVDFLIEKQNLDQAEKMAKMVNDEYLFRDIIVTKVVDARIKVKQFQQAEQLALIFENPYYRSWVLHKLVTELICAKQFIEAELIIRKIEYKPELAVALRELATALVQAGYQEQAVTIFTEAQQAAHEIEDKKGQADTLKDLATALVQAGYQEQAVAIFTEAQQAAREIEDKKKQASTLKDLATALVQARCEEKAIEAFNEATQAALGIKDKWDQQYELEKLIDALAEAGQLTQAEQVMLLISEDNRKSALHKLAFALFHSENFAETKRVMMSIKDKQMRSEILEKLANDLAEAKQFDQAEQVALLIENDMTQSDALIYLSGKLSRAKLFAEAERVALMVSTEGNSWERTSASALRWLAVELAESQHFKEAERVVQMIEDKSNKSKALQELATTLVQAGHEQKAIEAFNEAAQVTLTIEDKSNKSQALRELATTLVQAGHEEKAIEVFNEATQAALGIKDKWDQQYELKKLIDTLVEAGQLTQAEHLVLLLMEEKSLSSEDLISIVTMLGNRLLKLGQETKAKTILEKGCQLTENIRKTATLEELAIMLAKARNEVQAKKVFKAVEEILVGEISSKQERKTVKTIQGDDYDAISAQSTNVYRMDLDRLLTDLADVGYIIEAGELTKRVYGERSERLRKLSDILIQKRRFIDTFVMLGVRELDELLEDVAKWHRVFEEVENGFSITILREVTRIVGWLRSDWSEIHEILCNLSD